MDGVGSALPGLYRWRRKARRSCCTAPRVGSTSWVIVHRTVNRCEVRFWTTLIWIRACGHRVLVRAGLHPKVATCRRKNRYAVGS